MSNTPPEEQAKPKRQYSRKNHRREKNSKNAPVETSQQEVLKTEDDSFKKGNSGELTQKELP